MKHLIKFAVNEQQNNHRFSDSNKNLILWLCSSQKHKQNLTALVNCKAHPQHKYLPIQKCHFVPEAINKSTLEIYKHRCRMSDLCKLGFNYLFIYLVSRC
jgi:hypothetical protein